MARAPSAADLAEIAGGKGSARDRLEAAATRKRRKPKRQRTARTSKQIKRGR